MSRNCPNCDNPIEDCAKYCRICGHEVGYLEQPKGFLDMEKKPLFFLSFLSCVVVIPILTVEIVCLLLNSWNVFDMAGGFTMNLALLIPYSVKIISLEGAALQAYWIILIAVICACFVFAIVKFARNLMRSQKDKDDSPIEKTGLFWICISMSGLLFLQILYLMAIYAMGYTIDVSWMKKFSDTELMLLLANASVWEEIVTRVFYIGLPICIIALATTRKLSSIKCLLGGFDMSKTAVALIVISALIFGFAHNDGWGAGKIAMATLMGLLAGYLFVRFGLYASILLHFTTDYLSAFDWMGMGGIMGILTFGLISLGIPATLYMCKKLINSRKKLQNLPIFCPRHE